MAANHFSMSIQFAKSELYFGKTFKLRESVDKFHLPSVVRKEITACANFLFNKKKRFFIVPNTNNVLQTTWLFARW
jgi:hypothetical protein